MASNVHPIFERLLEDMQRTFPDSRDPDPSRKGIFQTHNCYRCRSGELPCKKGHPRQCGNLIARND